MPGANRRARLSRLEQAAVKAGYRAGCAVIHLRDGETFDEAVARYRARGHHVAGGLLVVPEVMSDIEWVQIAEKEQRELVAPHMD